MVLFCVIACTPPPEPPRVPERPRFVYEPRAIPSAAIEASGIELALQDDRQQVQASSQFPVLAHATAGAGRVEVSLPDRYLETIRPRAASLVSSTGETLRFRVALVSCSVEERQGMKRIDVRLEGTLLAANGDVLARGRASALQELHGPAHDDAELHELHRAAALEAFDELLRNVFDPQHLNSLLRARRPHS